MPARAGPKRVAWADGVRPVPIRTTSKTALQALSAARRWGFSAEELERLQSFFRSEGREPTDVELAGIAQSWSEHCSYKTSRPFLVKAFSSLHPKGRVLGTGDAGVMRFEEGFAYA